MVFWLNLTKQRKWKNYTWKVFFSDLQLFELPPGFYEVVKFNFSLPSYIIVAVDDFGEIKIILSNCSKGTNKET